MLELYNDDCLNVMERLIIKNIKIDAIITDPPYNISKKNNFSTMNRRGIDFGAWDKNADIFTYIDLSFKLLNKNGSIVIFNDWKKLGDIVKYAENLGFECKDMIRLEKTNPMPRNIERRYVTDYEVAVWLVMPKSKWTFNRQSMGYERPKFSCSIQNGMHPTQKNLQLIEWLVKIHSNENDLILDPFMGSGTTGLACKNLNRRFIGIELNKYYFEIAKNRINND